MCTAPVSGSTSITTACEPNGELKFGGLYSAISFSAGSIPAGRSNPCTAAWLTCANVTVRPPAPNTPAAYSTPSTGDPSRCAATCVALASTLPAASSDADPAFDSDRELKLPDPYVTWSVSPCTTAMSSIGSPSRSATSWANAVSWPCPDATTPTCTVTLPVRDTATTACSHADRSSPASVESPNPQNST